MSSSIEAIPTSPTTTAITTPTTTATTTPTTTATITDQIQVPSILNNNYMKIGAAFVAFIIFVLILYFSFRPSPEKVGQRATEITDDKEKN